MLTSLNLEGEGMAVGGQVVPSTYTGTLTFLSDAN
jgi:hypothetical protein